MRNILISVFGLIILLGLVVYLIERLTPLNKNQIFGVSYSPGYAQYLGLNYQETYKKIIGELGFKYVRLMAQWDEIEKEKGKYDFSQLDWLMNESEKHNIKVTLAVGRKTPRWPECHLPDWAKQKDYQDYRVDLLKYIEAVVKRYKNYPSLEIWQVENEPFLSFGLCKPVSPIDLTEEINLVTKFDGGAHKIIITDSGELSTWRKTALAGDLFGTTLYRTVWSKWFGYFNYDWVPAIFYQAKLQLVGRNKNQSFVIELQGEPWLPDKSVHDTPLSEQAKSLDIKRLKNNVAYSQKFGLPRSYLWGVEWWYWVQNNDNDGSFLEYVKSLKK